MAYPSPAGLRVNSLVLAFALVTGKFVLLRLFTRLVILQRAGLDDLFVGLAMVCSIALTTITAVEITKGLGKHVTTLTEGEVVAFLKTFWGSIWTYYLALFITKLSILTQYFKLFPTRRFRIICKLMFVVVIGFGIWSLFGSIFLCFPVQFFWDKNVAHGRCMDRRTVWFTNAGLNIAQEVILLLMPIPVFKRLNISKHQKRGLMLVFGFGGVVCIVSAVRFYSLLAISDSTDPSFDNTLSAALSVVEVDVGILCTCLPALRPLLAATIPRYFQQESTAPCCNCGHHAMQQPVEEHNRSMGKWPYTTPEAASTTKSLSRWSQASSIAPSQNRPSQSHTPRSHPPRSHPPQIHPPQSHPPQSHPPQSYHRPPTSLSTRDLEVPIFLSRTPPMNRISQEFKISRENSTSLQKDLHHPLRMSPPSPQKPTEPAELPPDPATIERIEMTPKPLFYSPKPIQEPDLLHTRSPRTVVGPLAFHKPLPITPLPVATGI